MDKIYNVKDDVMFFIYAIAYCNTDDLAEQARLTAWYRTISKHRK